MDSAKNTHRAKFSYVKRSDIERLIATGQIDANDIVYTNDTHENIFIGSDLSIHPIQSKIYRFSDISTAESELNIATDTYEGQIVAILTNDTYVAYIVNKRGDAYYVSKLDEGNADVNYDALGNLPIYNLVGTLDKFVIVSELSDGVYKIRGQYKICLGDATVYSSANDNFFLVGHSDGVATIRKITSSDIFDYTVMDNAIASESSIPTKKWLAEQKYATESYVDAKLAAMNFITKEEVSDYVADAISKNLESLIDQQIETKLNERLTSAEASDITNLF